MFCGYKMKYINFELTTECPLQCPQCYCTLNTGKDLDKNRAIECIKQAAKYGIAQINLSGGETLCYPYLYEIISCASLYGIDTNVALSGIGFDIDVYNELITAGVTGIYVSMNGASSEINEKSRRGFKCAVSAIRLLHELGYKRTTINWVMQSSNADDFDNMIRFAENNGVAQIVVMALKPNSKNELINLPSRKQMISVSNTIVRYNGPVKIRIESCFSPMLALSCDSFLVGNTNTGLSKGCTAALSSINLNVDGLFSPCRHLNYPEKWDDMNDYWENSKVLQQIRQVESNKKEPCMSCKYSDYCRHCLAINDTIQGKIYIGNSNCCICG